MNNKEFLSELSVRSGKSSRETASCVRALLTEITEQLEGENPVAIQNFGVFDVKKKLERVLINPTTKKKMLVPPKMVIGFKPSISLKEKLNQEP